MQLSAPTPLIDPTLPPGAAVAGAGTAATDSPPGAFSAMLSAETAAAVPTAPAPSVATTPTNVLQFVAANVSEPIAGESPKPLTRDQLSNQPAATDTAAQQDAIAAWLAANGLVPTPPSPTPVPDPASVEIPFAPAGAETATIGSETTTTDSSIPTASSRWTIRGEAGRAETSPYARSRAAFISSPAQPKASTAAMPWPGSDDPLSPQISAAPVPSSGFRPGPDSTATNAKAPAQTTVGASPLTEDTLETAMDASVVSGPVQSGGARPVRSAPEKSAASSTAASGTSSNSKNLLPSRSELPAEKFAAVPDLFSAQAVSRGIAAQKKVLSTDNEQVADQSPDLGIDIAKSKILVPAFAPSPTHAISSVPDERASLAPAPLTFDALVKDSASLPEMQQAHAARRAVDSAMAIVDHFTTGGQRSVSLQFSVSGVDLAVRVELRGDSVHTTFRTDSAELRTALAHEWQAVNVAQPGDRAQRLAEPVFTSSGSDSLSQADSDAAGQRESGARQNPSFTDDLANLRSSSRARSTANLSPVTAAVATRSAPLPLTGRLHAFA